MDWTNVFSNEWFIGIVCGIISGIVVYWITTRVYTRKQDKEYQQKVKAANNEILYTIRPLIVNRTLPSGKVWLSLIQATSRKYQVGLDDLYTVGSMRNDLIKEVLDNPFLGTKQKEEYTTLLESFDVEFHKEDISEDVAKEVEKAKKSDQINKDLYSLFLSVIAGVAASVGIKYQDFLMKHNTLIALLVVLVIGLYIFAYFLIYHQSGAADKTEEDKVN